MPSPANNQCPPSPLSPAKKAQEEAYALAMDLTAAEREELWRQAPRLGLKTPFRGATMQARGTERGREAEIQKKKKKGEGEGYFKACLSPPTPLLPLVSSPPASLLLTTKPTNSSPLSLSLPLPSSLWPRRWCR